MRRQCLVAVLTSQRQDTDETTESGDVTTVGKKKASDDDALIANTLGKHAAKYLKALQARNGRETKRVAHAWDGWTAPKGNNPIRTNVYPHIVYFSPLVMYYPLLLVRFMLLLCSF